MYICIDFDGTIVDHRYPDIGAPAPEALEWMGEFTKAGAKLILFTMRSGVELLEAANYLASNGVALYGVNRNPDQDNWTTSPKAYGHLYIDDAAFGCPKIRPHGFARDCVDWGTVGPAVLSMLREEAA
jgi:predicted mannosyl-3-phosphoglycerate phosphatase (HAD superfamily)